MKREKGSSVRRAGIQQTTRGAQETPGKPSLREGGGRGSGQDKRTEDHGLPTTDYGLKPKQGGQQAFVVFDRPTDDRPQTTEQRPKSGPTDAKAVAGRSAEQRPQTTDNRLQTTDHRPATADGVGQARVRGPESAGQGLRFKVEEEFLPSGNGYDGRKGMDVEARVAYLMRRGVVGLLAIGVLTLSRWLGYQLRFDFDVPMEYQAQVYEHWWWVIAMQMFWLILFRQFTGIYRYFSLPELRSLAAAIVCSGACLFAMRFGYNDYYPPLGVIVAQSVFAFLGLAGMRAAWRIVHARYSLQRKIPAQRQRNIIVIGAGDAGASLVRELKARPNLGRRPVAFLDDDQSKWGSHLHDVPIVGAPEDIKKFKDKLDVEEVVIAMPSATPKRLGEVVNALTRA
ncbi:MAG TPA: hypothetical protein VHI52_18000, partial [Verrucomicrobiae bacterium]|nr:hypothetical protein [Verrucomicrobiae bacterium]